MAWSLRALSALCIIAPAALLSPQQQTSSDVATILRASLTGQVGNSTVTDVSLSGSVEFIAGSDDETVPFVFKALSSGSTRTETQFARGTLVEVRQITSTGASGAWTYGDGVNHPMAGHNLLTDSSWCFPAFIVQRLLIDPRAVVIFHGIDGRVAHFRAYETQPSDISTAAAVELQHLSEVDIYLDANTLQPVRFDFNIHPDMNALVDIPVSIKFSNYVTVSGITMPMHIQKYVSGSLASDVLIRTVDSNAGLTLSDFVTN